MSILRSFALFALLVLAPACRPVSERAAAFSGPDLRVEVSLAAGEARTGDNELRLVVRDGAGRPVDDARVEVAYSMEMAGMAPMGGRIAADAKGGGEYVAHLDLSMTGTWTLSLHASRPGGATAHAEGSVRTGAREIALEAAHAGEADEIEYYTCPMHPSVHEARPGKCPICGMELVPVRKEAAASGVVRVDPARLEKIGVRFATAVRAPLEREIRATGSVGWDETRLVDVTPRVSGTVVELAPNPLGAPIEKGALLARIYSPELWAAQRELRSALAAQASAKSSGTPERADALVRAARARLRLFGLDDAEVARLAASAEPVEAVALRAPASGFLVEKRAVAGGPVEPGAPLFRIAPRGRVWVEARIPESDAALVAVGQVARLRSPALPGRELEAKIAYVYPELDAATRTLRARLELEDPDGVLRPGAWLEIVLVAPLGERVQVPAAAVIYAGPRRVVFVQRADGRLEPRDVAVGVVGRDSIEIVSGLEPGERVVASGNFLIAAESRLRSAVEPW
jgi:Cu(I)/Ag(I) efflux system membrane fusion protein